MAGINRRSLSEQLYQQIRDDIITGKLKQGEKINMKELQEEYQVSMTPLREAMLKLAQDRYVESFTNQYSRVIEITDDDIRSLLDLCSMYDCYSIERCLALDADTRAELITKLEEALDAQARHIELQNSGTEEFEAVFNNFHSTVYAYSGNPWLLENATQANRLLVLADNNKTKNDYPMEALEEHRRILDAIREGDPDEALKASRYHRSKERERFGV